MFMQSKIRPKSRLPSIAAAAVIGSFLAAGSAWAQMDSLSIMAPASPGGGWDGTARAMQQALQKENIVKNVEVTNVPGAGGTIGLAQFAGSSGQGDELMRSEERRVGKEGVSTGRSRWSQYHEKKKNKYNSHTKIYRITKD